MKTILTPTDFSEASRNAVMYAAELAKYTNSKLILFNVYFNPASEIRIPVLMPTIESMGEYSMDELKKMAKDIQHQFDNGLVIECHSVYGFEVEQINEFTLENKIDFIVMGLHGAGFLKEHIIGSTTTSLIRKSHCPVMAIYQNIQFKPIKKIVLACDYVELDANTVLQPLKELVNIFDAHIYVLHVDMDFEMESTLVEGVKVEAALEDLKYSVHNIESGDIVASINSFVIEHEVDIVVMIPRHHSFIDRILFEPDTKRMAFHTKVPLLSLHE